MSIVYLVHGFNVADTGKNTTDKFVLPLVQEGFKHVDSRRQMRDPDRDYVIELDYGWTGLAGVRICDRKLGVFMAEAIVPGSIIIAHSNGCAIASFAAEAGALFEGMVMIQPALNRGWRPPRQVRWMDVYYNKLDFWTWVAAFLPGHRWGAMGNTGPSYKDPVVTAYDTQKEHGDSGHNVEFKEFEYWGPTIIQRSLSHR